VLAIFIATLLTVNDEIQQSRDNHILITFTVLVKIMHEDEAIYVQKDVGELLESAFWINKVFEKGIS